MLIYFIYVQEYSEYVHEHVWKMSENNQSKLKVQTEKGKWKKNRIGTGQKWGK